MQSTTPAFHCLILKFLSKPGLTCVLFSSARCDLCVFLKTQETSTILQSPEHPQKVRLDQINDELCLLSFIVRWVILVAKQHKLQAKLFFWQKKSIFLKRLSQWFPYQILVLVPHHAKSVLRSSSPTMSLLSVIQTRLNAGLSMKQQSLYWIFLLKRVSISIKNIS